MGHYIDEQKNKYNKYSMLYFQPHGFLIKLTLIFKKIDHKKSWKN